MGVLKEMVNEVLKGRKKKWQILKECCEDDIKKMIDEGVPIRVQLKLILESGVIEKLTLSEYYKMLKNHFGYTGKKERIRVFELSNQETKVRQKHTKPIYTSHQNNLTKRKSVKEALKEDIDILKVAGINIDEALNKINKN